MKLNNSIRTLRKKLELTQEQFAAELGIKRSLIGAYEEGRAEPRLELLNKMAKMGGITLENVLSGNTSEYQDDGLRQLNKKSGQYSGNIPLIPIKAAAGYSRGFADQEVIQELPHFNLPMLGKGNYRAFEITGDSMLPLASGTVVVGEHVENLSHLKNGKTYVLVTKADGIVYKRVFNYLKENGKLFLVSDNSLYKPYAMEATDIVEVWAAKAYISIRFPDTDLKFDMKTGMITT